ncbi:MAG: hypothetical protein WD605_02340 [Candidatus Paceibacterota bacterium]
MNPKQPVRRRQLNFRVARKDREVRQGLFLRQFFIGGIWLTIFIILGAVMWYGSRLEMFTITIVEVDGGETISHSSVKNLVEAELRGEYYNLIPKRFSLTYPKQLIISKVKEVPRVKDVIIEKKGHQTILLTVDEYYPFALWCQSPEKMDSSPCYFLDVEGYSFIEAPPLSGSSMLRYFDNGATPEAGQQAFSAAFMGSTSRFAITISKDFGFGTVYVERFSSEEVLYHIVGGGVLKTNILQDVDETIENLAAVLGTDEFRHLAPGNFQYIDLRFGSKIFINEEIATSTSATTPEVEAEL